MANTLIPLLGLTGILVFLFLLLRRFRGKVSVAQQVVEFFGILFYLLLICVFLMAWSSNDATYYTAIDPIDSGYTPLAGSHIAWLILFFVLSLTAQVLIWIKGKALPPLLFVISLSVMCIGVVISIAVLLQVTDHEGSANFAMVPLPVYYIIISCVLIAKAVMQEAEIATQRTYANQFLNRLNILLANGYSQPVWVILLMIPLFAIVMCILTLFGQDPHAITKVFTDTATWRFSQQTHPPYLDHLGHYLCTVAACGDPIVVKPLRLGRRHGNEIIVNRQLQVANAFEELMQEKFTSLHRIIRHLYDKYGYPLSKKITTPAYANLTYRLMKPLEYFFLFVLYLCCTKPEAKIARQYSLRA